MTMADRDGFIWYDGEMVPWREATTHTLTHSLHYGVGVFEGIRAYETTSGTAVFRLKEHTQRLFDSAHIMGMEIGYTQDEINEALLETLRLNQLKSAYIRPLCFYGSEGMGLRATDLKVHTIIAPWFWGAYLGSDGLEKGIRIKTSSFMRNHVNINMCKAKSTGNYVNSVMALREALDSGADEALLLDMNGFVAEGSGENFFMVRQGKLYTPHTSSALEGITRDTVITLAKEMGIEVIEKQITRDEVYIADEAFFTGTAAEVTPIRSLDRRDIGSGTRGPITDALQKAYFDTVYGRNPDHLDWLSFV
jgi:branched-chain amino acid aminotransferase